MKTKWCEHVEEENGQIKMFVKEGAWTLSNIYKFCPQCGANRPKKKELWEKFIDVYYEEYHTKKEVNEARVFTKMEEVAREHILEEIKNG